MSGGVVWMTGLPASGKSTLAALVRERRSNAILLDGDEVRDAIGATGYGPAARDAFYRSLGELAALLARQGFVAVVAATAPRRAHRAVARKLAPAWLEVHVKTPLATCEARDPKGLYARARRREVADLPRGRHAVRGAAPPGCRRERWSRHRGRRRDPRSHRPLARRVHDRPA